MSFFYLILFSFTYTHSRKNSLVVRTQLSVRVHSIIGKSARIITHRGTFFSCAAQGESHSGLLVTGNDKTRCPPKNGHRSIRESVQGTLNEQESYSFRPAGTSLSSWTYRDDGYDGKMGSREIVLRA